MSLFEVLSLMDLQRNWSAVDNPMSSCFVHTSCIESSLEQGSEQNVFQIIQGFDSMIKF
jgi:hypothetical protein